MLYRGLKRTGRVVALTAGAWTLASWTLLTSPGELLKRPYAVLFLPLAPLALWATRCESGRNDPFGEYDAREGIGAQEFKFSYTH